MVHELHRLLPALVFEEHDGPVRFLLDIETYSCAEPFFRSANHLPQHAFAGKKLQNLYVEAAGVTAELEHCADLIPTLCKISTVCDSAAGTGLRVPIICVVIVLLLRLLILVVRAVLDTTS